MAVLYHPRSLLCQEAQRPEGANVKVLRSLDSCRESRHVSTTTPRSICCPRPMHRTLVEINTNPMGSLGTLCQLSSVHGFSASRSTAPVGGRGFSTFGRALNLTELVPKMLPKIFIAHMLLWLTVNILMSMQSVKDTYKNKTSVPNTKAFG